MQGSLLFAQDQSTAKWQVPTELPDLRISIYLLIDEDGYPRYVGRTKDFKQRLVSHRINKKWLSDYLILEVTNESNASIREKYWISHFLKMGFALDNKNRGGSGSLGFTAEQKQNLKEAMARPEVQEGD